MRAKDHVFSVFGAKKNPIKEGETRFCQIGPCLPPLQRPLLKPFWGPGVL